MQTSSGWDAQMKLEDVYVEGLEFEPDVEAWMKKHTVGEVKALAHEVEAHGEPADDLEEFYTELRSIEKEFTKHKDHGHYSVKS